MTSVEELFKGSTSANGKRKPTSFSSSHYSKVPKLSEYSDKAGQNYTLNNDDTDDNLENNDDDIAGPNLPPDSEAEEPDDEEGRFFGGGVTKDTAEVLDIIEERDNEEYVPDKFDTSWLRKLALGFEKKISRNAELRAKYEEEPQKFMKSEADLDDEIKALSILSEHPDLYSEFAKLGCVNSLVSLLSHENTDISIDAIEIMSELIDEDVEAKPEEWNVLVDALLEADLLDLLAQNLERLDETNDADRSGVYQIMSVLENLASQPTISEKVGASASLLQWLLLRAQRKESPVSQNKQYATEVLAILLQTSPTNRSRLMDLDGTDILLQLLSSYRKRDPEKDSNEEEFMENLFDSVTCLVDEVKGKDKFIEAEGVELCLIMLREGKMSRTRALRLLDHAMNGQQVVQLCEKFVDAAGLRTIFGMFMRKQDSQTIEHIVGIFAALLRQLPGNSPTRIRVLAKFVEKDYAKVVKLMELRQEFKSRLSSVEQSITKERSQLSPEDREAMAGEWLSRRLDAGLFGLQTVDLILAWLVAEDAGAKRRIRSFLTEKGESFADIYKTLQEQVVDLGSTSSEEEKSVKEMLQTLMSYLQ